MKECDILGVKVKTYSDPPTYFQRVRTLQPHDLRRCGSGKPQKSLDAQRGETHARCARQAAHNMTLVNIGLTCSFLNDFELGIAIPISITGFGIGESLIPGSPQGLQDSGIIDFPVLNPGIKITGWVLDCKP